MRPFDPEPPIEPREPIIRDTRNAIYLALAAEREAAEERMIRELEEQDRYGQGTSA